jgi:hypothetical protein
MPELHNVFKARKGLYSLACDPWPTISAKSFKRK